MVLMWFLVDLGSMWCSFGFNLLFVSVHGSLGLVVSPVRLEFQRGRAWADKIFGLSIRLEYWVVVF